MAGEKCARALSFCWRDGSSNSLKWFVAVLYPGAHTLCRGLSGAPSHNLCGCSMTGGGVATCLMGRKTAESMLGAVLPASVLELLPGSLHLC